MSGSRLLAPLALVPSRLPVLVLALVMTLGVGVASPVPARADAEPDSTAPRELRTEVPELNDLHHAIQGMWTDAAGRHDFARMRAYLPDIENATEALAQAKLPRVLRDRAAEWTSAVDTLRAAVSAYGDAVRGRDDGALLEAAAGVRERFGALVESIHPPFREIDRFHAALHPLVHGSLPAGNLAAIRTSVARLARPMRELNRGVLPGWLSSRQAAFVPARRRLSLAVDRLTAVAKGRDLGRIRAAGDSVHERFEELAHLLQ